MENKISTPANLGFMLSAANRNRSIETVTILAGAGKLNAGTALGEITVSKKYVGSADAEVVGREGAEVAVAILAYETDASGAEDVEAVVVARDAEVITHALSYDASVDDAAKVATKLNELASVGIIAR